MDLTFSKAAKVDMQDLKTFDPSFKLPCPSHSLLECHIFFIQLWAQKTPTIFCHVVLFSLLLHLFSPKNILPVNGWHKYNQWCYVERQFQCKWATWEQDFKCSSFLVSLINDRLRCSVISVYIEGCCGSVKCVHISRILQCSKVTLKKYFYTPFWSGSGTFDQAMQHFLLHHSYRNMKKAWEWVTIWYFFLFSLFFGG